MAIHTDLQRTGTFQWKRSDDNTWEPRSNPHVKVQSDAERIAILEGRVAALEERIAALEVAP